MFVFILISLFCVLISWLHFKWRYMKDYWVKKGVPQAEVHPVLGSMTYLLKKNTNIWMHDLYQKYPHPYVGIWVFWRKGLVINCPELARQILVKDFDVFRNRLLSSGKTDPMGALNIFTANDPLWSSLRRRMTTVFTSSKLRGWHELYQRKVADLVYRINTDNEKGIKIDLKTLFADYTTDIIGESSFGISCEATRNGGSGAMRAMTREFEKYSTWRGLAWSSIFFFPELVDIFRFSFWPKHTVGYFRKVFNTIVAERGGYEKPTDGKRDLLDVLLKIKQDAVKDNQEMDLDILLSNALIFLQGGYDTSSSALGFLIHELAYQPQYQQKMYEELVKAKEALQGKEFEASDLAELPYLNAAIKETLRKYPIMGWLDRVAEADYQLNENLTIPAGTVVYVNVIGIQRDSKYYPDPMEFKPERFLGDNVNKMPYLYLPFGEGPRGCIGKRIGQNTMRYALASIITTFEILPIPGELKPNEVSVSKKALFYLLDTTTHVEFRPRNSV